MSKPSIFCVVPTIRPEKIPAFRAAWDRLFRKHDVKLVVVTDGDDPVAEYVLPNGHVSITWSQCERSDERRGLFCRRTDAVRNLGFLLASTQYPDYVLTLDDDVHPLTAEPDPIEKHLEALSQRVPISWMNTAMDDRQFANRDNVEKMPYLRGFPYKIREEAPVMASHGVWFNVPDFDGKTQLELSNGGKDPLPYSLPYFHGPVPRGCYFPVCGMNLMVHRDALPYLYFAPMGADSGFPDLHRFADIWMGILLKRHFDRLGWALYTGASVVDHTRASDPHKNVELEKLGMEWNEMFWQAEINRPLIPDTWLHCTDHGRYWKDYLDKSSRFAMTITKFLR